LTSLALLFSSSFHTSVTESFISLYKGLDLTLPHLHRAFLKVRFLAHYCLSFIHSVTSYAGMDLNSTAMLMIQIYLNTGSDRPDSLSACIRDIKHWMPLNVLKLNDKKTRRQEKWFLRANAMHLKTLG